MSGPLKENNGRMFSSKMRLKRKLPLLRTPMPSTRYSPYTNTPQTSRVSRIPTKKSANKQQDGDVGQNVLSNITNLTPVKQAKTPQKRTPLNTQSTRKAKELEVINEDILSVVGKTWRVMYCSPLYNLDYRLSSLQNYQKLLSAHLESESQKGFAFEVEDEVLRGNYRAEFKILEDFGYYVTDSKGMCVSVYSKKKSGKNSHTPVLEVIFCYFGNEFEENTKLACFTCLPLCLVKGPVALAKCIFSWFEVQFDCRISPVHFSPIELSWYASLWAGTVPDTSPHNLELCYSFPSTAKGLDRIIYSINSHDAKGMWQKCHKSNSAIFTSDESGNFMEALETHFYHHFKINLGALSLSRVGTSLVFIGCDGRIKISQAEYLRHIMQQITVATLERAAHGRL